MGGMGPVSHISCAHSSFTIRASKACIPLNEFVCFELQGFMCYMFFILKACSPVFSVAFSIFVQEIHTQVCCLQFARWGKYTMHTKPHFFFLFIQKTCMFTCYELVDYLDMCFVTRVTMSLCILMCVIDAAQ